MKRTEIEALPPGTVIAVKGRGFDGSYRRNTYLHACDRFRVIDTRPHNEPSRWDRREGRGPTVHVPRLGEKTPATFLAMPLMHDGSEAPNATPQVVQLSRALKTWADWEQEVADNTVAEQVAATRRANEEEAADTRITALRAKLDRLGLGQKNPERAFPDTGEIKVERDWRSTRIKVRIEDDTLELLLDRLAKAEGMLA